MPGVVGRSVGDALPVEECGCSCEMQLGEFTTSDQKIGSLDDGLDCGLPSCVWWGRWALDLHTTEGSLGAQPQPLTTATSVLSDGAMREQGSPDCHCFPSTCFTTAYTFYCLYLTTYS